MSGVEEPRTRTGRRLLWMFGLERNGVGRIVTRTFDARLTRRIVEEFIPRIEEEAWQNGPLTDEDLETLDALDARGGRQAWHGPITREDVDDIYGGVPPPGRPVLEPDGSRTEVALPPPDPTLMGKSSVPG